MIDELLKSKLSCLIIAERMNRDIIVGAPHHAPAGVSRLPCPEHPDSDENTGFLAWHLAENLDCCRIIANYYTIDANKYLESDYIRQIVRWTPKYLVEIHGHGRNRTRNDIEISCGSIEKNKNSIHFAQLLQDKCQSDDDLIIFKHICGDFKKITFRAEKSKSTTTKQWLTYHIELPPELRLAKEQKGGKPPTIGYKFCDYLVEVIKEVF